MGAYIAPALNAILEAENGSIQIRHAVIEYGLIPANSQRQKLDQ